MYCVCGSWLATALRCDAMNECECDNIGWGWIEGMIERTCWLMVHTTKSRIYARPYNKRARNQPFFPFDIYSRWNDGKAFVLGHKRTTSHNANSFSLKRSKQSEYYYTVRAAQSFQRGQSKEKERTEQAAAPGIGLTESELTKRGQNIHTHSRIAHWERASEETGKGK